MIVDCYFFVDMEKSVEDNLWVEYLEFYSKDAVHAWLDKNVHRHRLDAPELVLLRHEINKTPLPEHSRPVIFKLRKHIEPQLGILSN
jgi:hypothetical protein